MLLSIPGPSADGRRRPLSSVPTPIHKVAAVLRDLPALGCVLCQVRTSRPATAPPLHWTAATGGAWPLPDHPWLHELSGTLDVRALVDIDSDGPCERLAFLGVDGQPWMRVWLLPDSDYCAWDQLLRRYAVRVEHQFVSARHGWWAAWRRRHGALTRWRSTPARFSLRRVAGFNLLGLGQAEPSALARRRAEYVASGPLP